jgi:hypothetical protein
MGRRAVNVLLDDELYALLSAYLKRHPETSVSMITRTALRAFLGATTDPLDAGWREGFTSAYAKVLTVVREAVASLPPAYSGR